jgi:CRP/FNR family transcriptional regulator, cyclic AMP receptor protein
MELNWVELVGYAGTTATIATYSMRTIVPLRIAGILSSLFFIAYALLVGVSPLLMTELVLLPINCWRLCEAVRPKLSSRRLRPALLG